MANEVVAGKLVKLACQRHLRDLELGAERGLVWRADAAQFRIGFYPRFLRHSKGEWARKPVELSPWQKFIIGSLFGWKRADGTRRFRSAYLEVSRKNGKALAIDTPVPTLTGWKRHGDLRPGDRVFDRDGQPVAVLAASEHYDGPCYAVRFSDGGEIIAHAAHEWDTRRKWYTGKPNGKRGPLPLIETQRISETLRCGARGDLVHSLGCPPVLECEVADMCIPPYTLGAWLGDGNSASANLTVADLEIVDAIRAEGVSVEKTKAKYRWRLSFGKKWNMTDGFARRLRGLGILNAKRIPTAYLRGGERQRRDLLAGLFDTDGHVTKAGQCELVTVSPGIRDDALELLRGLGIKALLTEDRASIDGRDCGARYRVQFWATAEQMPLRIARKRDRLRRAIGANRRSRSRQITECRPVGARKVNCIEVDGGFYLAGRTMAPTHNSTMLAGVGLDLLVCDGEPGAEIYAAATKKDQARIIFDEAKRMVASSPALSAELARFKSNISVDGTASKFEPLSSDEKTLDGLNPHGVLIDELHKHKTRALLDVLDTALGARRQPLLIIITTAGDDSPESVYAQENDYATKVLEGTIEDDATFAYIATIDKGDNWADPAVWEKANPNLGISVKLDDLERQAQKAAKSPSAQSAFKRLRLNVRTSSAERAIDMETWAKNGGPWIDPAELRGRKCWGGLDLSSKIDISAWVKLFEPDEPGGRLLVVPRFWMPLDTLEARAEKDRVPYREWFDKGFIEVTHGNVIDHDAIEQAVLGDAGEFALQSVAYDPWNATQLAASLLGKGVPMVEFVQGLRSYSEPTKELINLLVSTKLDHGDNPVLKWMASNLKTQRDKNENLMPHKLHSTGRIDGITGLIMAIGRRMQPAEGGSYLATDDLLVL